MPSLKRPPYHPRSIPKKATPRVARRGAGQSGFFTVGDIIASTIPISYSINGGSDIPGVQSNWERQPIRVDSSGVTIYGNWHLNTWGIDNMTMTTFEDLLAQQGQTLTSLESNDQSSRNSRRVYNRAILHSVVNGSQLGLIMTGASLVFRVDVTS